MNTRESSRRSGYLTTVTLTPAEAAALADASADHAAEMLDFARGYLGEFIESIVGVDPEPRWVTLADAISTLDRVVEKLRAIERLGGRGPECNVVQLVSGSDA